VRNNIRKEKLMTNFFEDENGEYVVLINDEGQYSLWRTFKAVPAGWTAVGPRGGRTECLAYIEEHWTDMRPKSLIERMNKSSAQSTEKPSIVE
jgi:MbtH protein